MDKRYVALLKATIYTRSMDVDQEDGKVVSSKKTGGIKVRVNPSFRSHLRSESNDKSQSEEDVELVSENLINL